MGKYGITQVARMLGITPQTLRFYEGYGILENERNTENQYRNFSNANIDTLMSIRKYRNCGFSVAQSAEILGGDAPSELARALEAQTRALRHEIDFKRQIIAHMETLTERLGECADIETAETKSVERPVFYKVICTDQDKTPLVSNLDELAYWAGLMPLSQWTAFFPPESFPNLDQYHCGFSIHRAAVRYVDDSYREKLHRIEPCRAMRRPIAWRSGKENFDRAVKAACANLRADYGAPAEDVSVTTLCNLKTKSAHVAYGELLYPTALRGGD